MKESNCQASKKTSQNYRRLTILRKAFQTIKENLKFRTKEPHQICSTRFLWNRKKKSSTQQVCFWQNALRKPKSWRVAHFKTHRHLSKRTWPSKLHKSLFRKTRQRALKTQTKLCTQVSVTLNLIKAQK